MKSPHIITTTPKSLINHQGVVQCKGNSLHWVLVSNNFPHVVLCTTYVSMMLALQSLTAGSGFRGKVE